MLSFRLKSFIVVSNNNPVKVVLEEVLSRNSKDAFLPHYRGVFCFMTEVNRCHHGANRGGNQLIQQSVLKKLGPSHTVSML